MHSAIIVASLGNAYRFWRSWKRVGLGGNFTKNMKNCVFKRGWVRFERRVEALCVSRPCELYRVEVLFEVSSKLVIESVAELDSFPD